MHPFYACRALDDSERRWRRRKAGLDLTDFPSGIDFHPESVKSFSVYRGREKSVAFHPN